MAGGIRKGDILIADLEDLENLDASDFNPWRINANEVLITQEDEFIFPVAEGTANLSGRDDEFREPTLRAGTGRKERSFFSEELQGESGGSQPTEPTDDAEARADFWSIQGDFISRHHNELRVQLFLPKEETFPVPYLNQLISSEDKKKVRNTYSLDKKNDAHIITFTYRTGKCKDETQIT